MVPVDPGQPVAYIEEDVWPFVAKLAALQSLLDAIKEGFSDTSAPKGLNATSPINSVQLGLTFFGFCRP